MKPLACESTDCEGLVTWRVMWPGRAPVLMCGACKDKALAVARGMGFELHAEAIEQHGVRFLQDNALAVAVLAIAGFSIMYLANPGDLDDPVKREEFLAVIRELREGVPRERAFLVLEALNEMHPDREQLHALVEEMRRRT